MFSEEIIEVLDYMGEKMGIAIDWSNQNVMPYLETLFEKYIDWEIATSCIWIAIGVALLVTSVFVFKLCKKKCEGDDWDFSYDAQPVLCVIFIVISGVSAVTMITVQVFDIARCICLPELQIYQLVNGLMEK